MTDKEADDAEQFFVEVEVYFSAGVSTGCKGACVASGEWRE